MAEEKKSKPRFIKSKRKKAVAEKSRRSVKEQRRALYGSKE